jgi:hypothetical protein
MYSVWVTYFDLLVLYRGRTPLSTDKGGKSGTAASRDQALMSVDQDEGEYYIPSVDLLTAQDLLSFELLDINIVQEIESVPNNTPGGKPSIAIHMLNLQGVPNQLTALRVSPSLFLNFSLSPTQI